MTDNSTAYQETEQFTPTVPSRSGTPKQRVASFILDTTDPGVRKDAHCPNCGRIFCNYWGEVKIVIVGLLVESERPFDVQCSRCKTLIRVA